MVRPGLTHLLLVALVSVLSVSDAVQDDTEFPSLMTVLGSKLDIADDYYEDNSESDDAQAAPKPCCFPLVWEGRSAHMDSYFAGKGKRGMSRSFDEFHVDGSNRRLAGRMVKFDMAAKKHLLNISWIFHIGSNRSGDFYLFDPSARKCQHRVLHNVVWRRQCIPDNATFEGTYTLGPVGGLTLNAWGFHGKRGAAAIEGDNRPHPRPRVEFCGSISVVPSTCVPVLLHEHGFVRRGIDQQQYETDGQAGTDDTGSLTYFGSDRPHPRPRPRRRGIEFTDNSIFTDVQTKITKPSVFIVPAYCKKGDASTLFYGDNSESVKMPTILERFLVL